MQLQELKPKLRERFGIETIDIFGSYARNEANRRSDLDLLVTYSNKCYSLFTIIEAKQYLRRKLRIKVDIVSKEFLNRHIRDDVLKEAVPV
jgi:uncharacterized protein